MPVTLPPALRLRRDELVLRAQRAGEPAAVFTEASAQLRRLVSFRTAAWMATDPATGLPVAPTVFDGPANAHGDLCRLYWRQEFLVDDVNLFRNLARAAVPAATLRSSLSDPHQSARYRGIMLPVGTDDELRAVLRVGNSPWGVLSLWRTPDQPRFTPQETRIVASLCAPLGETLRLRARSGGTHATLLPSDLPGMLVFDRTGTLTSANEQARAWLADLPPSDLSVDTDLGITLPMWLMGVVFRARAGSDRPVEDTAGAAAGDERVHPGQRDGTARARVRTRSGLWLVCHASSLRDVSGTPDSIAVVIEPATRTDIAPVIVEAYQLTEREQQITSLIARGASTDDIANALHLSTHTVRDYVKAILRKVEVPSRGRLLAKLFAEHYWPAHKDDVVRLPGD